MALHEPARWILAYDIACPRRGSAVLRFLKKQGLPLQYSVFVVEASAAQLQKILLQLEELIDPARDDVRAYRWPLSASMVQLGRPMLPDGMLIETPPIRTVRRVTKID